MLVDTLDNIRNLQYPLCYFRAHEIGDIDIEAFGYAPKILDFRKALVGLYATDITGRHIASSSQFLLCKTPSLAIHPDVVNYFPLILIAFHSINCIPATANI